jgi:hypothetical protein
MAAAVQTDAWGELVSRTFWAGQKESCFEDEVRTGFISFVQALYSKYDFLWQLVMTF